MRVSKEIKKEAKSVFIQQCDLFRFSSFMKYYFQVAAC